MIRPYTFLWILLLLILHGTAAGQTPSVPELIRSRVEQIRFAAPPEADPEAAITRRIADFYEKMGLKPSGVMKTRSTGI